MADELLLSRAKYEELEKELEYLKSVRKTEVAEHLKEAASYGDISENAEYDAAKEEQAELEAYIRSIEEDLRNAKIIEDLDIDLELVNVGQTVRIADKATGDEKEFSITGARDIDPDRGIISNKSPIGKALMGKRVGETAEVILPSGDSLSYEILEIYKK